MNLVELPHRRYISQQSLRNWLDAKSVVEEAAEELLKELEASLRRGPFSSPALTWHGSRKSEEARKRSETEGQVSSKGRKTCKQHCMRECLPQTRTARCSCRRCANIASAVAVRWRVRRYRLEWRESKQAGIEPPDA
jgi:hypothetical protein